MAYRKGDMEMCAAINRLRGGCYGRGTCVGVDELSTGKRNARVIVTLYGHEIARLVWKDGALVDWRVDDCGYSTNVTLRRINAIVHLCVGLTSVDFKRKGGTTRLFWCGRNIGECRAIDRMLFAKIQERGAL